MLYRHCQTERVIGARVTGIWIDMREMNSSELQSVTGMLGKNKG